MRRTRGERDVSRLRLTLVVCASVPFVFPFLFMISTATRPKQDYLKNPTAFPTALTKSHLDYAWNTAGLGRGLVNSLIVAVVSASVLALISLLGAFWFIRHAGRIANAIFVVLVSMWIVPWVVWVLPMFVGLSDLGLSNNLIVLGIVLAGINAPFGLYFVTAYLRGGTPPELFDAARADGATTLQQFRMVVLPLSRPALGTVAALGFVWAWGDLFVSLILLQDPNKYTQTVAAAGLASMYNANVQETAAAALLSMLPLLLVFGLAQRSIVRGFTAGVSK